MMTTPTQTHIPERSRAGQKAARTVFQKYANTNGGDAEGKRSAFETGHSSLNGKSEARKDSEKLSRVL